METFHNLASSGREALWVSHSIWLIENCCIYREQICGCQGEGGGGGGEGLGVRG